MSLNGNRQGKPEEEMFLNSSPSTKHESPIVEPLRINKPSPVNPAASQQREKQQQQQQQQQPQPSSATPPPKSSSTPPYPDDRPRPQPQQKSRPGRTTSQPPYPDGGRMGSPATVGGKTSSPHQNTMTSPASTISPPPPPLTEYPLSLRPWEGRDSKPVSLAERRGNAPKPLPESPGPETPDKDGLFQRAGSAVPAPPKSPQPDEIPYPEYHQQYFPPPSSLTAHNSSSSLLLRACADPSLKP